MRARRTNTGVRFPADMYEQLRRAADERDVSVNWLVNRAVVDFLARLIPADEVRLTRTADEIAALNAADVDHNPFASQPEPCVNPRPHDPHTYITHDGPWTYCSGRTHPAPPVAEAQPGAPSMFFDGL